MDATAVGAQETWEIAIGQRAPLISSNAHLEIGAPADFLLLRAVASELNFGPLSSALVYSAAGTVVDTTVVAGRVLMRDRIVEGSEEVLARALESARRLGLAVRAGALSHTAMLRSK